ncbi:MAG TPA: universal stress protein [Gammaproteobacteria bacterium]|jgi:nucleotide-binding universal stress UspA family protein|nr:universal stress protein [Gammaproteobacteria bacterium]
MSFTILLPVDGSDCSEHAARCSERAARHVAHIASMVQGLRVHIVNVQPLGDDWMVRRMIKPEELATLEQEWGQSVIAPARAILEAVGVTCTERMVQGDVAQTIARLAEELACDQIIMGTQGRTSLGNVLLGSVASKVLHLSNVPVTMVK